MSSKITLHLWPFEEGELHLFNLDSDPYEEVDLAVEKEEKLNRMKELAREWAADLKVAFQPNRFPPAPFNDIFSHSDLLSSGSAWATLVITTDSWNLVGASLAGGKYFGSQKTLSPFWLECDQENNFLPTILHLEYSVSIDVRHRISKWKIITSCGRHIVCTASPLLFIIISCSTE